MSIAANNVDSGAGLPCIVSLSVAVGDIAIPSIGTIAVSNL